MIVYSTVSLLNQSTHTRTQRLIQWEDGSLVNHLLAASYLRNASVECRAVCEAEGCTAGTREHREEEKGSQVEQQRNVQVVMKHYETTRGAITNSYLLTDF